MQPINPVILDLDTTIHKDEVLDEASWSFLDSLDSVPTSPLVGQTAAWFGPRRRFLRLPKAGQKAVEVYHWGDSQIEGGPHLPKNSEIMAGAMGRSRTRLDNARDACASPPRASVEFWRTLAPELGVWPTTRHHSAQVAFSGGESHSHTGNMARRGNKN